MSFPAYIQENGVTHAIDSLFTQKLDKIITTVLLPFTLFVRFAKMMSSLVIITMSIY